jgi:phosphatidate phosphatase APP1
MDTRASRLRGIGHGRDGRVCWAVALLLSAVVLGLGGSTCAQGSPIKADEDVMFFPGFATEGESPSWTAHVHGWIFEPTSSEAERAVLEQLLRERVQLSAEASRSSIFRERARMFLVDNERSKTISVSALGGTFALAPSKPSGHFEGQIALNAPAGKSGDWIEIRALPAPGEVRTLTGRIQLIGRRGVSVVSDIDDTIKISNVLNKSELAANTFAREFRAVPGMAELYQAWASAGNVVFHYVSGSPWQLYPALAEFVQRERFPLGSIHLRQFRLKDRSAAEFVENRTLDYKLGVIDPLIRRFPDRQFVLVGDSGEKDPEVYAELAKRFPNAVKAILIRNVTGEDLTSSRFVDVYADVPAHITRRVFRETGDLAGFRP